MKYSNFEIFQNRNKLQIVINDNGELRVANCEKELDEGQVYSLFMLQAYKTCKDYFDYLTKHPDESDKLLNDVDYFLDMYSVSKKEVYKFHQVVRSELRRSRNH